MSRNTARSMQHSIPIPPDVKTWLKRRAKQHDRSLAREVVAILRQEKAREVQSAA